MARFDDERPEHWSAEAIRRHRKGTSSSGLWLVLAGTVATGAGIAVMSLARKGSALWPIISESLSARRKAVLGFISEVVPSQYGDAKFKKIAPNYDPDDPNLPRDDDGRLKYTTCGEFPCYIGRRLGVKNCITQGGLEQMRILGRKNGSWVDAAPGKLPRPGDLYGIGSAPNGGGILVHVGAVVDAKKDQWTTADAGQGSIGPGQSALLTTRPVDSQTMTSGGVGAAFVPGQGWTVRGKPRYIAGWIDIDKVQGATP